MPVVYSPSALNCSGPRSSRRVLSPSNDQSSSANAAGIWTSSAPIATPANHRGARPLEKASLRERVATPQLLVNEVLLDLRRARPVVFSAERPALFDRSAGRLCWVSGLRDGRP